MFTQAQAKQETQSMNNYEYTYFQVYNKQQHTDGSWKENSGWNNYGKL